MGEPAVEAVGLVKRFGDLTAVDGIDLRVGVGEVYGLLGPNGAGKTTFLRMLFGLIRPDAGALRVFGRSWAEAGPAALNGVAGFVESPRFYPYLSGRANLRLLAGLDATPADQAARRIEQALAQVDLTGRATDRVGGYSFGMRQRLGVAAALIRSPRLLVLDEPANGLDPAGIRDMRALVKQLASSGLTVLLSSHNMDEVEEICDNVTIMRTGQVAYHGSIEQLRAGAPAPGYRLTTDDDERAAKVAVDHPNVTVTTGSDTEALRVTAIRSAMNAYTVALGQAGIAVESLALDVAPLESLFFQLTETTAGSPDVADRPGPGQGARGGRAGALRTLIGAGR